VRGGGTSSFVLTHHHSRSARLERLLHGTGRHNHRGAHTTESLMRKATCVLHLLGHIKWHLVLYDQLPYGSEGVGTITGVEGRGHQPQPHCIRAEHGNHLRHAAAASALNHCVPLLLSLPCRLDASDFEELHATKSGMPWRFLEQVHPFWAVQSPSSIIPASLERWQAR
jgi:hypothetical protein